MIFNVHPSLLPRWRGAAPIERAIMAGDAATGVTIMRLTAGLDSGPVCAQQAEPIAAGRHVRNARAAAGGARRRVAARPRSPGTCSGVEQDDALATYAEKIEADDRRLDPERSAAALERVVRALDPHIGAFVLLDDGLALGVHRRRWPTRGRPRLAPASPCQLSLDGPCRSSAARPARSNCCRPATGPPRDERRGLPARSAPVSPARACAFRVIRRVFDEGAYADRALHGEATAIVGPGSARSRRRWPTGPSSGARHSTT